MKISRTFLFALCLTLPARRAVFADDEKPRPGWVVPAVAGGLFLTAVAFDRNVESEVNAKEGGVQAKLLDEGDFGKVKSPVELLGNPVVSAGLAGLFYAHGALAHAERSKRTAIEAIEATVLAGVSADAIKFIVGRNRPYDHHDSDEFRPFQTSTANTSFPSGHATTAFAFAGVVAHEYDSIWVKTIAFGLAGTCGLGRIYQSRHWLSDVVGGGLLGVGVAHWVCRHEARTGWSRRFYTDGRGLYFAQKFE